MTNEKYLGFCFESDALSYITIESEICRHYGIGSVQSSNLPPELKTETNYQFCISGINKVISGKLYAFVSGKKFTVDVSCVQLQK